MPKRTKWTVSIAVALAVIIGVWLWPSAQAKRSNDMGSASYTTPMAGDTRVSIAHPQRPQHPPRPGLDRPQPPPVPQTPPKSEEVRRTAYQRAVAAGDKQPGEHAFRATVDAFMTYNRAFAQAQATQEGISVEEVAELTQLGFLVLHSQRWPDVEDLLGRTLTSDERQKGEALMHEHNSGFQSAMRELVAEGASPDARWRLIHEAKANYLRDYFALLQMTPELFDQLLAGDLSREDAPAAMTLPDEVGENPDNPELVPQRPPLESILAMDPD